MDVMKQFFENLSDVGVMERKPTTEGRFIMMILAPAAAK